MISEDLAQIDEELGRHDVLPSRRIRLAVKRREILAETELQPTRTFALDEPRNLLASFLMLGASAHDAERYFDNDELRAISGQLFAEEVELHAAELREKS